MQKKSLIILSVFFIVLLLFSGIAYANDENNMSNDIKNGVNDAGTTAVDGAERLGDDVKNVVNDVASDAVNGAENLGDDVRNGVGSVENGIEGAFRMNNTTTDNRNAANYTATRTTGDDGAMGLNLNNQTTWVWIVLAIAAVVIVALVWYYAATTNNSNGRHNDDDDE